MCERAGGEGGVLRLWDENFDEVFEAVVGMFSVLRSLFFKFNKTLFLFS